MSYKKTGLYRSFISVITVGAILALAVVSVSYTHLTLPTILLV